VTSHIYWENGVEVQSILGRFRVKQARKREGNSYAKRGHFLHADFEQPGRSCVLGKSTIHGMLEGNHCLVLFYVGNVACVPIK